MSLCGGGGDAADDMRKLEAQRQIRINQGLGDINQIFAGFNPAFYQQRQQDYLNFAMPQFGDEVRRTQNQLQYSLADRGLLRSGAAGEAQGALDKETARQQQALVDAAFGQSQNLRQQVEGQRSSLIGQLQASADPSTTAQQALASAQQFQAPSIFQPLGTMLGNFANIYLAQQIANAAGRQQQFGGGFNFASEKGSQQIRRY